MSALCAAGGIAPACSRALSAHSRYRTTQGRSFHLSDLVCRGLAIGSPGTVKNFGPFGIAIIDPPLLANQSAYSTSLQRSSPISYSALTQITTVITIVKIKKRDTDRFVMVAYRSRRTQHTE